MNANGIKSSGLVIDMRSDTVTHPTAAMREAMANAVVGDDVFGDDPTVNKLEEQSAALLGKEAALFVPSGTMGNLISVLVHCSERGSEYIVGDEAHIHFYEQGGTATLGGVHSRALPTNADGTLSLSLIQAAIRPDDPHFPITRLVCLETTHNRCGGRILSKDYIDSVGKLAHDNGIKLHIDGARLMNAVVASGVSAKSMVAAADSVSMCLSKALAAPIGSVIAGTKPFIHKARRLRKAVGGGMRQAGIIAAAGIVALNDMVDRLAEDHQRAKILAIGLNTIPGLTVDLQGVETNIVRVEVEKEFPISVSEIKKRLIEKGIGLNISSERRIRFMTHYQIGDQDIETTIKAMKDIAGM